MKFFHVYNEKYFKGLEKNGLINKNTGFKIQHCFTVPEEMKFNRLAAKGGRLHSLLKEGGHPFYVDRIAGGMAWYQYDFDKSLIREYSEMLGDWFLGFQLHESGSNRRYIDWGNITRKMGSNGPYDAEELKRALLNEKRTEATGITMYNLNMDSPETYAAMRYAETVEEYMEEMKDMFRRRMAEVDGHILPCDSGFAAIKLENDAGMKSFMPEVGGQIPQMRQQVALTRGIADMGGKTWGTYYECWFHRRDIGYTMPCYNTEPGNEWYLPQELASSGSNPISMKIPCSKETPSIGFKSNLRRTRDIFSTRTSSMWTPPNLPYIPPILIIKTPTNIARQSLTSLQRSLTRCFAALT